MGSRKVNTEGIDEELLIASIGRRRQDGTLYHAQEPPAPAPEEESVPETEPPPVQYTAKEKPLQGEVLAVGNGTKDEEMVLKVGDTVLYGKYAGTELEVEGTKYLIMRQSDVLAVLG